MDVEFGRRIEPFLDSYEKERDYRFLGVGIAKHPFTPRMEDYLDAIRGLDDKWKLVRRKIRYDGEDPIRI